jgi:tetrapyrrole methylase family protein/MazG family protein
MPDAPEHLRDLVDVVRRLRAPDGCPWDREQTHRSLRPYLLEEAHEVLEAIDSGDPGKLRAELGDLLLQIVMHAAMAEEAGQFTLSEVAEAEAVKMIHRHPHVFGNVEVADADEVLQNWEKLKAHERGGEGSILDGTPASLPALARALAVQKRAARVGIEAVAEIDLEELSDLTELLVIPEISNEEAEEHLGEILFRVVDAARRRKLNAEDALREVAERYAARIRAVEALAREQGTDITKLERERARELWRSTRAMTTAP